MTMDYALDDYVVVMRIRLGSVYTRTFLEMSVFESLLYCIVYVCLHTSFSYAENG